MAEPFIAEIRIWGTNFSPRDWMECNGALLSIGQFTTLFSLISTVYGGNGVSNFKLPDLAGRTPLHSGQGPGLSNYFQGERGGFDKVPLREDELPSHTHAISGTFQPGNTDIPTNNHLGIDVGSSGGTLRYTAPLDTNLRPMDGNALQTVGSGVPHNNMQPVLALNFCIALDGMYPQRN